MPCYEQCIFSKISSFTRLQMIKIQDRFLSSPTMTWNPPISIQSEQAIPGPKVMGNSRSFHSQLKGLSEVLFDGLFVVVSDVLFDAAAVEEIQQKANTSARNGGKKPRRDLPIYNSKESQRCN